VVLQFVDEAIAQALHVVFADLLKKETLCGVVEEAGLAK